MGAFFNLTMEVKTLVEEHERFRASLNAIRSHDDTVSRCDELELDFEVIGLPQHRLIPVRNIEPITIPRNSETANNQSFVLASFLSTHDKRRDTRISSVSSFGTISANRTTKLTDEDKNFSYKTRTKRINKIATLQLSKIIIAGRMLF